jgi:hypothetical protein
MRFVQPMQIIQQIKKGGGDVHHPPLVVDAAEMAPRPAGTGMLAEGNGQRPAILCHPIAHDSLHVGFVLPRDQRKCVVFLRISLRPVKPPASPLTIPPLLQNPNCQSRCARLKSAGRP